MQRWNRVLPFMRSTSEQKSCLVSWHLDAEGYMWCKIRVISSNKNYNRKNNLPLTRPFFTFSPARWLKFWRSAALFGIIIAPTRLHRDRDKGRKHDTNTHTHTHVSRVSYTRRLFIVRCASLARWQQCVAAASQRFYARHHRVVF